MLHYSRYAEGWGIPHHPLDNLYYEPCVGLYDATRDRPLYSRFGSIKKQPQQPQRYHPPPHPQQTFHLHITHPRIASNKKQVLPTTSRIYAKQLHH